MQPRRDESGQATILIVGFAVADRHGRRAGGRHLGGLPAAPGPRHPRRRRRPARRRPGRHRRGRLPGRRPRGRARPHSRRRRGPRSAPTSARPGPTPATRASPTRSASTATGSRSACTRPLDLPLSIPGSPERATIGAKGSAVVGVDGLTSIRGPREVQRRDVQPLQPPAPRAAHEPVPEAVDQGRVRAQGLAGSRGCWTASTPTSSASRSSGTPRRWRSVLAREALEGKYDLLATPATGSKIVCAALVRKGLLSGTPKWISTFPEAVRLESADDLDPQAPAIAVHIPGFSRPVLNFQVALRDDPPLTEVFVAHLKSKLPTQIDGETWYDADPETYRDHRNRARRRDLHDPAHGGGHRAAGAAHRGDEGHRDAGDRARRPQRRPAQQHHQHPHRAAALPGRRVARRRRHRALHGADAAGVPRHPRRLLHPRPPGPARVARPRPGQRAVLRQQPAPPVALRRAHASTTTTSTTRTTAPPAPATTAS